MGVFDQAARYAAQADVEVVPQRLLAGSGITLTFRDWLDTRTLPLPGGPDRIADLVAALIDPTAPDRPWLMVLEFQAQPDPDKLDVTLEEVAILRSRARHGDDRRGKYRVAAGMVFLRERPPETVLDMNLPHGAGTRHEPLVWHVASDNAVATLGLIENARITWGMLFWVPLMAGGGEEAVITRWKEVVLATVPDRRTRGDLACIALVLAELAGCVLAWQRGLEGFAMTESQVVNQWIRQGELKWSRQNLLRLLDRRFPGQTPEAIQKLIAEQESQDMLDSWFDQAATASTFEEFLAFLKR